MNRKLYVLIVSILSIEAWGFRLLIPPLSFPILRKVSILSIEAWGFRLVATGRATQSALVSILSIEAWGFRHFNEAQNAQATVSFNPLNRGMGIQTPP